MRTTTITIAVVAALAALTGCDADPTTENAPEVVDTTEDAGDTEDPDAEAETEEPDEPDEAELGTRENPLALGVVAVVGDYEVAVTEIDLDADERILEANEFNEPAELGQYVLVTLETLVAYSHFMRLARVRGRRGGWCGCGPGDGRSTMRRVGSG